MSDTINGGPAWPMPKRVETPAGPMTYTYLLPGVTKRYYFAAFAMQGIISSHNQPFSKIVASLAYEYADAMLMQMNKEEYTS